MKVLAEWVRNELNEKIAKNPISICTRKVTLLLVHSFIHSLRFVVLVGYLNEFRHDVFIREHKKRNCEKGLTLTVGWFSIIVLYFSIFICKQQQNSIVEFFLNKLCAIESEGAQSGMMGVTISKVRAKSSWVRAYFGLMYCVWNREPIRSPWEFIWFLA